jgi:hypothetical protein
VPFSDKIRDQIERRAKLRCEYCHAPQAICGYQFHLEHIQPRSREGSDSLSNRALACASCNLAKGGRIRGTLLVNYGGVDGVRAGHRHGSELAGARGASLLAAVVSEEGCGASFDRDSTGETAS